MIRVLVMARNEFDWPHFCGPHVVDGELARLPHTVCDTEACGCQWACYGLASGNASTTVRVASLDASPRDILREYLTHATDVDEARELAIMCNDFLRIANDLPVGTTLLPRFDIDADCWQFNVAV